jgi:hypothetical protein
MARFITGFLYTNSHSHIGNCTQIQTKKNNFENQPINKFEQNLMLFFLLWH